MMRIADIITPDRWAEYGVQRTMELAAFWQAGLVAPVAGISLPNGGATINMPFFGDLSGDLETLSDSDSLTPAKFGTSKQVAVVVARGRAWGINDLAPLLSGADPARALMDGLAGYWARQYQKELFANLSGVFAASSMSALVHDISAATGDVTVGSASRPANTLNGWTFIEACQRLGDAKGSLVGIGMHSNTEASLAKQDLIDYIPASNGSDRIPFYRGKRVIVDDSLPVSGTTYTTYLFGPGSFGWAEGVVGKAAAENDRDILAGEDVLAMRRRWIMHPRGMRWIGTPAGDFPTRAELATGTNWERVFETKAIPMVQIKHKIL